MKPLSKSQFKLGLDCLQKLRHYRDGLPSTLEDNSLLRLLAEGGGAVEALQRAVEPPAWVGADGGADVAPASLTRVREALAEVRGGGTRSLYEVTILQGDRMARLDLLRLRPDGVDLVEIKSKSVEEPALEQILHSSGRSVAAKWVPYVQDLAFQAELLRDWLAAHAAELGVAATLPITPKLLLVKKGGRATAADCLANFRTRYVAFRDRFRAEVSYAGPGLRQTDLLVELDATAAVDLLRSDAQAREPSLTGLGLRACMDRLTETLRTQRWPAPRDSLGVGCRKCEYRKEAPGGSGVQRCWGGDIAAVPHHILSLTRLSKRQLSLALESGDPLQAKLTDLNVAECTPRQQAQWRCATRGRDEFGPGLVGDPYAALEAPPGVPVYFLDFETARYPVPYRPGGRVNELIPFQFEGHRLPSREAALYERELLPGFLELGDPAPLRAIVQALRDQFGHQGPIYHWSAYERQVIDALRKDLADSSENQPGDEALIRTCDALKERLRDLCTVAQERVALVRTDGSYSIKRVLPEIWRDGALRAAFARGGAPLDPNHYEADGDPYRALPGLSREFLERIGVEGVAALTGEEAEEADAIKDGGLAMVYYHYVRLFGGHDAPEIRRQFRQYCQLDSAAMVMAYDFLRRAGRGEQK